MGISGGSGGTHLFAGPVGRHAFIGGILDIIASARAHLRTMMTFFFLSSILLVRVAEEGLELLRAGRDGKGSHSGFKTPSFNHSLSKTIHVSMCFGVQIWESLLRLCEPKSAPQGDVSIHASCAGMTMYIIVGWSNIDYLLLVRYS